LLRRYSSIHLLLRCKEKDFLVGKLFAAIELLLRRMPKFTFGIKTVSVLTLVLQQLDAAIL